MTLPGDPSTAGRSGSSAPTPRSRSTEDTVFYGASLSKAVFGVLVMHLVDDGLIDLDTPLVKYLKEPLDTFARRARRRRGIENLRDLAVS